MDKDKILIVGAGSAARSIAMMAAMATAKTADHDFIIRSYDAPPPDRYDKLDLSGPYVGERKKVKRNRAEIKKRRKQKHRKK